MTPIIRFCRLLSVAFGSLVVVSGHLAAQTATDAMLEVLLRPQGWRAEWAGPGGSGITEVAFVGTSTGIVAKIRLITPFEMTCENPVTLAPGKVTFDGCRDPAVALTYDATNAEFPFQGRSPRGYEWRVRPK